MLSTYAYPSWFTQYMETYDKKYSAKQMADAFNILLPKYEHIKKNVDGGLHLRLHKDSDKERKISRRLHLMKKKNKRNKHVKKKNDVRIAVRI